MHYDIIIWIVVYRNTDVLKTFEMVNPRGGLSVISLKNASPSTPVHILVPFIADNVDQLDSLIESFHQEFGHDTQFSLHIVFGSR